MRRALGGVLIGVLLVLGGSACSPDAVDPTAECTDQGAPPPGEPGSADVLLTVGHASGTSMLTTVLYADGWLLTLDGADASTLMALGLPRMTPSTPAARQWQPGYLGACQQAAVAELAAEELAEDQDLGEPQITDQASTVVNYYGGERPTAARAYALGHEEGTRLSPSDKAGREVLKGIIDALYEAPETGELLDVETVQLLGSPDVDVPSDWPGPPLAEIIEADAYCGVLSGPEARELFEYLATSDESIDSPRLEVMPPGLPTCT